MQQYLLDSSVHGGENLRLALAVQNALAASEVITQGLCEFQVCKEECSAIRSATDAGQVRGPRPSTVVMQSTRFGNIAAESMVALVPIE